MVIKCTPDGHSHPVQLEELDVSEPAVRQQCADGRKSSICVETVDLPSLCSFRFMASETPKTFPFYMRVCFSWGLVELYCAQPHGPRNIND